MRLQINFRNVFTQVVSLLFVLLFVYAAVSKILDFERFQVQIAQSPLLSAYASWISWAVIVIELLIALMLMFSKTKIVGLFLALSLMTMFTAYIFIILHYSSFVPCSCGGILEKMTWNVHLVFNLCFVCMAIVGILLQTKNYSPKRLGIIGQKYPRIIIVSILGSILFVTILFLSSEQIIHNKNPFIRHYPQRSIKQINTVDLKFNSYYFAGFSQDVIYLGNYTDPLHLLAIDLPGRPKKIQLQFDHRGIAFQSIKIIVRGNYFYLMDGTVPCIYIGRVKDWKITHKLKGMPGFTLAQPLDSTVIAFRNNRGKYRANVLGIFSAGEKASVYYAHDLLEKQIDGVFDTDGMLQYNEERKQILYIYFYRNQFIAADKKGDLQFRGHTIDTVAHAKIKVAYLKGKTERQMGAPPFMVNALAATRNNLLFVNSKVPGRYDKDQLWKNASIIDVYDLKENAYLLSFPIYQEPGEKIQNLFLSPSHLYVIIGNKLVVYELSGLLEKEMKSASVNIPDA